MNPLLLPLIFPALSVIVYIDELTAEEPDGLRVVIYVLAGIVSCLSMGYCVDL